MAFRKRSGFRRRRFPRAVPGRAPLARVRREWTVGFDSSCEVLGLQYQPGNFDPPTCGSPFTLDLFDPTRLQLEFSDKASIVRVLGDLWFMPVSVGASDLYNGTPLCDPAWFTAADHWRRMGCTLRLGIRPFETNSRGGIWPSGDPLVSTSFDFIGSPYDWTEMQLRKSWQHVWVPKTVTGAPVFGSKCNDWVPMVEGTSPGAITTVPLDSGPTALPAFHFDEIRPWHLHLDLKKRFRLQDYMGLMMMGTFGDTFQGASPAGAHLAGIGITGSIKLLVEV